LILDFFYANNLTIAVGERGGPNGINMARPGYAWFHVKSPSSKVESPRCGEQAYNSGFPDDF
jgi:hypothetical protein